MWKREVVRDRVSSRALVFALLSRRVSRVTLRKSVVRV